MSIITRVKNYTCLRNTMHGRIYVSMYIAFLRVVIFYAGINYNIFNFKVIIIMMSYHD